MNTKNASKWMLIGATSMVLLAGAGGVMAGGAETVKAVPEGTYQEDGEECLDGMGYICRDKSGKGKVSHVSQKTTVKDSKMSKASPAEDNVKKNDDGCGTTSAC